jgi:hypothetical protein
MVLGLALCGSCTTHESNTIVVNGLDCGLVRTDMAGNWAVAYLADTATLQNCDDPTANGTIVTVGGSTINYVNAIAYASPSGASFNAVASGPNRSNELLASIEADSCLALVQTWEQNDKGWVQCLGTLDRTTHLIAGICDAIDLDLNMDGAPEVACDLSHSFQATIATP